MAQVKIRFECGCEDRVGKTYGPFEFVQLTYESLRVGPDGDFFACYDEDWRFDIDAKDHGVAPEDMGAWYSDVVIFAAE